jgi:dienelactone hydrolase
MRAGRLVSLVLLAAVATPLPAQPAPAAARDLLLLLSGNDTISVERFVHSPTRLESELLIRSAGARFNFSVQLAPDGGATLLENAYRQASADPASPPIQSATVRFTGDSAIAEITAAARSETQRFATQPGVVPFLNPSMALAELMIHRARAIGRDSARVPIWNVQGGTTVMADVVRNGTDSVVVNLGGVAVRLAVNASGDILGGTIPSQNLRVVRVRGTDGRALSVEKPDYSAPPGAPYTAEDVTIPTSRGYTLAGTLTIPRNAKGRVPAMVTITGSGPEDRDEALPMVKGYRPFRQFADTLGRNGIAVLRMDDRGFGASGGNGEIATSADFADDIRSGLAYLRTRAEIDPARLGLIGHSEGALIAPMVAADDTSLRAIVLMAGPSQTGRTILDYQMRYGIEKNPQFTAAQRDSAYATVPKMIDSLGAAQPWMKFFLDYDPLATARRVKASTLILQGATDRQVTAAQAEALAAALRAGGNRDVTVRVFPDANHLFVQDADGSPAGYTSLASSAVRADVLGALVSWIKRKMR